MTRSILESGYLKTSGGGFEIDGQMPALPITAALHDSLMARIDRLARAKEIAQIGAVIGRTFSRAILSLIAP